MFEDDKGLCEIPEFRAGGGGGGISFGIFALLSLFGGGGGGPGLFLVAMLPGKCGFVELLFTGGGGSEDRIGGGGGPADDMLFLEGGGTELLEGGGGKFPFGLFPVLLCCCVCGGAGGPLDLGGAAALWLTCGDDVGRDSPLGGGGKSD